jgi:hypothetical protein
VAECRFRVRKLSIYTCFIFKWWPGWTGSVRFSSIGFRLWKPKLNRTRFFLWFFNWLIRFFFYSVFSVFFSGFLGFSVFLLTSIYIYRNCLGIEHFPSLFTLNHNPFDITVYFYIAIFYYFFAISYFQVKLAVLVMKIFSICMLSRIESVEKLFNVK